MGPGPAVMSPGVKSPTAFNLKSPAGSVPSHLFLNKRSLAAHHNNGSSTSLHDMPPPPTPGGIRAQLGHLLPRHAYFRARVVIHKISSVPFVGGEFAVRWKFKGVQANPPGATLLTKMKQKTLSTRSNVKESEADPMSPGLPDEENLFSPPLNFPTSLSSTLSSRSSDVTDSTHSTTEFGYLSIPSNATLHHPSSSTSSLSATPIPSGTTTPDLPLPLRPPSNLTPAKGSTPFLSLKDHAVTWSQILDTTLKFDIDRETTHILPNPLKLVVVQRIVPGDPHGNPQNPRLGAVYLNLAEYVGQGNVDRRYLLKESKTNAILQLMIELEYVSGETQYTAPPLPKGEILNGIAGYLEKTSVKKRPRALDLYGPYRNQEELEDDLLSGLKSTARVPKTARSERKAFSDVPSVIGQETETEDDATSFEGGGLDVEGEGREDDDYEVAPSVAFDVQRLPMAYGTKTTEVLIDSLFNPVMVTDRTEESPFTIYEPALLEEGEVSCVDSARRSPSLQQDANPNSFSRPKAHAADQRGRSGVGLGLTGTRNPQSKSIFLNNIRDDYTSTSDSASEQSHVSSSVYSHGHGQHVMGLRGQGQEWGGAGGGVRAWWRRNISRMGLTVVSGSGGELG